MEGSPSTAKLSVWRGGSGETGGGGLRTITLSTWGSDPVSKHHHCAGLRGVTQCPQHSPTFVGGLPCPPTSVTGDSTPVPNNHNHEGRTSPCLQVPAWLHFGVSPHIPKHRDSRTFGGGREGGSLPVCGDHCTSVCGGHCVPQAQPQCLSGGREGGKDPHIYKYHLFWVMQGGEEGVITPVPRHHHSSSLGGHNPGPQIQGQPHDPPLPFLPIPS